MEDFKAGVGMYGPFNIGDCSPGVALLVQNQAKEVEGVGVVWVLLDDLTIDLFSCQMLPCVVVLHSEL